MRGDVRPGRQEAEGDGGTSMQGRDWLQIGGRARGRAHPEHECHGGDAGRVEAQRLVERQRFLPSRKERVCDAGRGAGRKTGECGAEAAQEARTRRTWTKGLGAEAGAERTRSIQCMSDSGRMEARTKRTRLSAGVRTRAERTRKKENMSVTPEVSQLWKYPR